MGGGTHGGGPCSPGEPLRRFDFDGAGLQPVVDSLGGPPGVLRGGATLSGDGSVVLDGVDGYVDLPDDLLPAEGDVTIEVWVEAFPGAAYRRIFDFGSGSDGRDPLEGEGTVGTTYLAVTPQTGLTPTGPAALVSVGGGADEIAIPSSGGLGDAVRQVVLTLESGVRLGFYVDGALRGELATAVELSAIARDNHWLGRSQYDQDPYLGARYEALRLYDRALEPCAVEAAYELGIPD